MFVCHTQTQRSTTTAHTHDILTLAMNEAKFGGNSINSLSMLDSSKTAEEAVIAWPEGKHFTSPDEGQRTSGTRPGIGWPIH